MIFTSVTGVTTLPYLLCFVVGLVSLSCIHAYPSGAGGCDGGKPAVGGSHLAETLTTGSLSDGGLQLVFNSAYILDPSKLSLLDVGTTYSVSVNGGPFRGVLIRMEGGGITMTPASNFQVASVCTESNVVGLTHTENSVKSGLTRIGDFAVSSAQQQIRVDVTVVVSNNANDGSEYYYSAYSLEATDQIPSDIPLPETIPTTPEKISTEEPNSITTPMPTLSATENGQSKFSMSPGVIIALIFAAALVICALIGVFLYHQKFQTYRDSLRATSSPATEDRLEAQAVEEAETVEAEFTGDHSAVAALVTIGAATDAAHVEGRSKLNNKDHMTPAPLVTPPSQHPRYKDQVHSIVDPQLQVVGVVNNSIDEIPVVTARISESTLADEPESNHKVRHRQDP